jgi:hypothetical protein
VKAGTDTRINPSGTTITIMDGKKDLISIPAASITEISYGQDVHGRVGAAIGLAVLSFGVGALIALAKSKKHLIGLTWATGDVKGGFAMQCGKNDYRGLSAALEGLTGKKAVDSDAMNVKNEMNRRKEQYSEDETGSLAGAIHRRAGERNGVWRERGTGRSSQDRRGMQ